MSVNRVKYILKRCNKKDGSEAFIKKALSEDRALIRLKRINIKKQLSRKNSWTSLSKPAK
jgi:hypothetical protein